MEKKSWTFRDEEYFFCVEKCKGRLKDVAFRGEG